MKRSTGSSETTAVNTGKTLSQEQEEELAKEEQKANEAAAAGETPTSASAPEETSQTEKKEEHTEEEVDISRLSEKAQKRFRHLSERAKRADELEAQMADSKEKKPEPTLVDMIRETSAEEKPKVETPPEGKLPWDTAPSPEETALTEEELYKRVDERIDRKIKAQNETNTILQNLREDVSFLEQTYPEYNPQSDAFDQDLVTQTVAWYKQMFQSNKFLRLADFAKQLVSLRQKGAEQGKASVTENLAKAAAEQAVSPAGAPGEKEGNLEDLIRSAKTPEELAALEKRLPH